MRREEGRFHGNPVGRRADGDAARDADKRAGGWPGRHVGAARAPVQDAADDRINAVPRAGAPA
jgi:hypothetical protein